MRNKIDLDSFYKVKPEASPCPICKRPLEPPLSAHHLVPKSKGGTRLETVDLHKICHEKIHSTFTENELAKTYNTIEKLLENEEVQAFVTWVANKPNDFYVKSKANGRKG